MNKPFIENDEVYEEEEELEDELEGDIEDDIGLDVFDEEEEDLDQISSYWKKDNFSNDDGYGRKRKVNKFSRSLDY